MKAKKLIRFLSGVNDDETPIVLNRKFPSLMSKIDFLMGVNYETPTTLDRLKSAGFKNTGQTTVVCNYRILHNENVKVLYDSKTDRVLDYWEGK